MDKILLDTDIFSEILKQKHEKVVTRAEQYHSYFGYYTITTITILEIIKGFHKVGRENHIARFLSAISGTEILTLNIKSAELAGRIYADLERTGQPIGRADPIIAAIALENNLVLSTGNISHYQRIQSAGYDLILDNWKI
ncbi:MAG: PIN domain-containing protein [Desulfobacterales bacterium]|uniref:PIN domain-containing protein n=1 Tax=Candidatus Desulfatibia profunda TaxID=2841695 RepID=A0A8J6TG49_9BACT|nr:PIN domain-containing protein [Candidatus Desulfatibia profunda]MBL7178849.1 PIN domain-containing protein [Desulfobacterales bacterium]MBL7207773.1 PIN domain-containing protein [Desulfobacterales bacterium]